MEMTPVVEVKGFSLKKGDFELKNVSFEVFSHEIFAILGKTGSGKTLLLESIAGFYPGAEGAIYLNGHAVLDIPIAERNIGFVYQDFGLFPHLTAFQNVSYGLRMQKKSKSEIAEKVGYIADVLSITRILHQYPGTLSGGEKQRTALARALVLDLELLVLDEPFSALDLVTKTEMYDVLMKIHERFGCAILFVTHDFNEARKLADRVGVMDAGRLKDIRCSDSLFELYDDDMVNRFFGLKKGGTA